MNGTALYGYVSDEVGNNPHTQHECSPWARAYACAVARNVVVFMCVMVAVILGGGVWDEDHYCQDHGHSTRIGDVVLLVLAEVVKTAARRLLVMGQTLFLKHTSIKQTAVCTVLQN